MICWLAIALVGATIEADGALSCGVPEAAMPSASASWPMGCRDLRLFVDPRGLSGLTHNEFIQVAQLSCERVSEVSGLSISLTRSLSDADIALAAESLRSGILAYAYFPGDDCGQQLRTRFNSRVRWTRELFLDTLSHELGHAFGLPHTSDRRDIMYPSIVSGRALDGRYGPHFSAPAMVARYGPRRPILDPLGWIAGKVLWWVTIYLSGLLSGIVFAGAAWWYSRRLQILRAAQSAAVARLRDRRKRKRRYAQDR